MGPGRVAVVAIGRVGCGDAVMVFVEQLRRFVVLWRWRIKELMDHYDFQEIQRQTENVLAKPDTHDSG